MDKQSDSKLITCVLRKGRGIALMEALSAEGHLKINFAFARGSDLHDLVTKSSKRLKEDEKEIVTIVADSAEQADKIFDFVFDKAEINHPGAGLIYMTSLGFSTNYQLPVENMKV